MSQAFSLQAFIFVIILVIYILASHLIEAKKVPYLHQSTIAIFMGILTAIFAKYGLKKQIEFSNQIFFAIILPPIIFSAGYSLRKSLFFQNFGMICFLGIIGTIIGFVLLSCFIFLVNQYLFNALTLTEVMMISSVMCATDTVAAITLIKSSRYPVLNAVLFGQGIINDAVAIILFRTISQLKLDDAGEFTLTIVMKMGFNFTYLFFFSVAFGTITGFGLSYLFKELESFNKHSIKQTSLILLNGYFTYLMGDLLGISGIISLFTCAIIMGHYCFMNISEQSQKGTGLAFETVSYISQAFVYAYLGASILSIEGKWLAVVMSVLILLSMPFIRAVMVYILPLIYKIINKPFILSAKQLKVCWFSGMVRGVIAFALCLQIESKDKKFITTVALVIVIITTALGSTLFKAFVKKVGLLDSLVNTHEQQEVFLQFRALANYKQQKMAEKQIHTSYQSIGLKSGSSQKINQIQQNNVNAVNNFEQQLMKSIQIKNTLTKQQKQQQLSQKQGQKKQVHEEEGVE